MNKNDEIEKVKERLNRYLEDNNVSILDDYNNLEELLDDFITNYEHNEVLSEVENIKLPKRSKHRI